MAKFERTSCCVCDGLEYHLILETPDRLFGNEGTFSLVACRRCGCWRTDPRPDKDQIRYFYPDNYAPHIQSRSVDKPGRAKGVQTVLLHIRSVVAEPILRLFSATWMPRQLPKAAAGDLLELGTGSGAWLSSVSPLFRSVTGYEFSDVAANIACENGLDVKSGDIEQLLIDENRSFDVIAAWMVIEHLHNPKIAISECRRILRPGGYFLGSVPENSRFSRLFRTYRYDLQAPTHLWHFRASDVKRLMESCGFVVDAITYQASSVTLFRSIALWANAKKMRRLGRLSELVAEGKRFRLARAGVDFALGIFHLSGRINIYARRPH